MGTRIVISIQKLTLTAELNESNAAAKLREALPCTVRMSRWGEEYYGTCPIDIVEDDSARELMAVGEIAYWTPGKALCFFFGPTPASTDQRPRAASPVVPLGRITEGAEALKELGKTITAKLTEG